MATRTAKQIKRDLDWLLSQPLSMHGIDMVKNHVEKLCIQLCKEQRELVADELKRYSEDLSIPNQYKINDLCMDAPMPEL